MTLLVAHAIFPEVFCDVELKLKYRHPTMISERSRVSIAKTSTRSCADRNSNFTMEDMRRKYMMRMSDKSEEFEAELGHLPTTTDERAWPGGVHSRNRSAKDHYHCVASEADSFGWSWSWPCSSHAVKNICLCNARHGDGGWS